MHVERVSVSTLFFGGIFSLSTFLFLCALVNN